MNLSAIVTKEDKQYVALCFELNIASQGKTESEALSNLKEAVELFLEAEDSQEVISTLHPAKMYPLKVFA